jgi:drug/metabolite transporter (DMT)-like permease
VRYLTLGGAQIAVGAAAIFARYGLEGAGPLAVSASRLAIAAGLLLVLAIFARSRSPRTLTRREHVILIAAGVALAAHFALWIWSLEYTTVVISTLLVTSTPIWTAFYDSLILKRSLSRIAFLAFVAGGVGLVMIVGFHPATPPPIPGHQLLGALLAFGGSLAIGAYLLLVREVRAALDTRAIVTRTYAWAALALVVAAVIARQPPPPIGEGAAWGGILAMALISQLFGHTAINASLRWFTPSAVSFATLLEPVIAAALALAIFHEGVPPLAIAGGAILLASVAVVLREEPIVDVPEPAF